MHMFCCRIACKPWFQLPHDPCFLVVALCVSFQILLYPVIAQFYQFQGATWWENPMAGLWKLTKVWREKKSHDTFWIEKHNMKMFPGQEEDWLARAGERARDDQESNNVGKSSGTDYRSFGNKGLLKAFEQITHLASSLFLYPRQLCLNSFLLLPNSRYFLLLIAPHLFYHASFGWTWWASDEKEGTALTFETQHWPLSYG